MKFFFILSYRNNRKEKERCPLRMLLARIPLQLDGYFPRGHSGNGCRHRTSAADFWSDTQSLANFQYLRCSLIIRRSAFPSNFWIKLALATSWSDSSYRQDCSSFFLLAQGPAAIFRHASANAGFAPWRLISYGWRNMSRQLLFVST